MEIDHDLTAGTLMIKQSRYIDNTTSWLNQQDAKTVVNPCESGMKLTKKQSPTTNAEREDMKTKPYRSRVGGLLYITTCTRPDVACVVTQLSRFLENPGQQNWRVAIRVLRYLKPTKNFGIIYNGNDGKVVLEAYTDADWGSNLDDRRSVSVVMIMIGNAPVVFKSKYQRTVALSSAVAEYMALSLCPQEQGIVTVAYVGTEDQLAEMLTKALGTKRIKFLVDACGIHTEPAQHYTVSGSADKAGSAARARRRRARGCSRYDDGPTGHVRHVLRQDPMAGIIKPRLYQS
ncbi:unnamed protein product [Phytophthora fragariaefolia]|uniref:Unnamed protein product n=1 Tax=Phytophthora fragariaefolia TaxID=1490495 RepID=A0A9W6XR34_9STRA|nr:unnamed protein product [Phytophthora fragariaefolia]